MLLVVSSNRGFVEPTVCAEGPTPGWRLAREADDDSERFAGQVLGRRRSLSSEGLGVTLGEHARASCKDALD